MIKTFFIGVALIFATICGAAAIYENSPHIIPSNLPKIRDVIDLPLHGLRAVEDEKGNIFFLSENGRYVVSGTLIDAWEKKRLKSVRDMRFNFSHMDLEKIGIKVDDLNPILLGTGSKKVVIFIDPQCHWCHSLIQEIMENNSLKTDYTFKIVAVPALGDESNRLSEALFCTTDDNGKRLNALLDKSIDSLKQPDPSRCKRKYDRLLVAAQMIGITRVPYIIAPDTRFVVGKPKDLKAWLTEGDAQLVLMEQKQKELLKKASEHLLANPNTEPIPTTGESK